MHIGHLLNGIEWGGVETHTMDLVRNSYFKGYQVTIFCTSILKMRIIEELNDCTGVTIYGGAPRSLFDVKGVWSFYTLLKKCRLDVLHCQLYPATRVGGPMGKLAGIPVILETIHLEDNWRQGLKKLFYLFDTLLGWSCVTHYIAVSKAVALHYMYYKGVPEEKISVVYNGIEPIEKESKELLEQQPIRFGFLGRLSHQKGVDVMLKSVNILKQKGRNCSVLIGGSGELETSLHDLSQLLSIDNQVTFLGHVESIEAFFNEIDVLILPSRFEGFPLVVLEASQWGKPVIASAVSGTREIIFDHETGLLFESEDVEGLGACMEYACSHKKDMERMGQTLRYLVQRDFDAEIQHALTHDIYRRTYADTYHQQSLAIS